MHEGEVCGGEQAGWRRFGRDGRWGYGNSIMCRRIRPYYRAGRIELLINRGWNRRRNWRQLWEGIR